MARPQPVVQEEQILAHLLTEGLELQAAAPPLAFLQAPAPTLALARPLAQLH